MNTLQKKKTIAFNGRTLRVGSANPVAVARERFSDLLQSRACDAQFLDAQNERVIAWDGGLAPWRPLLRDALNNPRIGMFINRALGRAAAGLIVSDDRRHRLFSLTQGKRKELKIPGSIAKSLSKIRSDSATWEGAIGPAGDYVFDPRTPSPGAHFRANLLIGDRHGFDNPLLTTPKAVVDGWGRGSSRAHSDRQILATRWDMLPEENGFPANRQFYLLENGRQLFYSANPGSDAKVVCRHATNRTEIVYELPGGITILRKLFVLPSETGDPLGVEAQIIEVGNSGKKSRALELVLTGMFGFPFPDALKEDVLYTCITVEPGVLQCHAAIPH